jgi:hypothetical protein
VPFSFSLLFNADLLLRTRFPIPYAELSLLTRRVPDALATLSGLS